MPSYNVDERNSSNMKTLSSLPHDLEYHLGLMEKQIKRLAELARYLPFADQQEEMNNLVLRLKVAAAYLRLRLSSPGGSTNQEIPGIPFETTF